MFCEDTIQAWSHSEGRFALGLRPGSSGQAVRREGACRGSLCSPSAALLGAGSCAVEQQFPTHSDLLLA